MHSSTTGKSTANSRLCHKDEIDRALKYFLPDGQVAEVRILDATTALDCWPRTHSGYFNDRNKLIGALSTITSFKGVYITLNPVDPALLARAANRIRRAPKGESTTDQDITGRRWVLIDFDPQRPAAISSTDAEHAAAIQRAEEVCDFLRDTCKWSDLIMIDSGNGAHILVPVDLPRDDDGLVERLLKSLAEHFDDDKVKIDTGVHNAARITKLPGTLVCKGDSTSDRPHRMSRLLSAPEQLIVLRREQLEKLAGVSPTTALHETNDTAHGHGRPYDIDSFIARNGFEVDGPDAYQGGRRWTFRRSPMCEHHGDGPYLIQFSNGALSAGCHHDSCKWRWCDLRVTYDASRQSAATGRGPNPRPPRAREVAPYTPFPVTALPAVVADYVAAGAAAIGCDPAFIALPLLACLARSIGNSRVIRLKRTWTEPAIFWAAIVGKSGTHKTPAIQAAVGHLQRKQSTAIADYKKSLIEYEEREAIYGRQYKRWKQSNNKATDSPPQRPQQPVCERYITVDTTIEALAAILNAQYHGILVVRDELAGWLGGIAEYKSGKGSDLGHWLASWSGVPMTIDRKTGAVKMIHVERAAVSLVGGIQPGVLRKAIGQEHLQDGLCARLLLAMPDPKPVRWSEATVDQQTYEALGITFDRLLTLEPVTGDDGNSTPLDVPLTAEAKQIWIAFFNRHRAELMQLDDDLAAAWSKLEAYAARFALIFQMCSWATGEPGASDQLVEKAAMQSAIILADWFGNEALRVYAVLTESEADQDDRELIDLIRRKGGKVTSRDLMRCSRRYRTSDDADVALDMLAKAGRGRWHNLSAGPDGGRPTRVFRLTGSVDADEISENAGNGEVLSTSTVLAAGSAHDSEAINRFLTEVREGDEK